MFYDYWTLRTTGSKIFYVCFHFILVTSRIVIILDLKRLFDLLAGYIFYIFHFY